MTGRSLTPTPITQRQARAFIAQHHKHHKPPAGDVFRVAVSSGGELVGVATVGRPVARALDDGTCLEVTRLCVLLDDIRARHAASKLYAMAWRIAREMGYQRIITYTLETESGASVAAAGWRVVHQVRGRSWDTPSRRRLDGHPTCNKTRWEAHA